MKDEGELWKGKILKFPKNNLPIYYNYDSTPSIPPELVSPAAYGY